MRPVSCLGGQGTLPIFVVIFPRAPRVPLVTRLITRPSFQTGYVGSIPVARSPLDPLAATTIRHIHFIISGAYKRAVWWRWVSVDPAAQAEPRPAPKSNPQPLTATQARIVNELWRDPN